MSADVTDDRAAGVERFLHPSRIRTVVGVAVMVGVAAAVVVVAYRERHDFVKSLDRIGMGSFLLSFLFALLGIAVTGAQWREILKGLGVRFGWIESARVFFTSQLGKYLPGSVWPALLQMEAGRARGANRRTMLAANLISLLMGCCVGLILACLLLPFYDHHALSRYWWALVLLPFLLVFLHPRAFPAAMDRAFAILHRPPLGERVAPRNGARAVMWSLASWAALGAHLSVLTFAVGRSGPSVYVLCTGAMALAFPVGVLFIPAPAGAGVREVVLGVVLSVILKSGAVLAVVVASRVTLIICDIVLAGLGALVHRLTAPAKPASETPAPAG